MSHAGGAQGRGRRFSRPKRREPSLPVEKRVEMFILRNSRNGYFTKFSTITTKFNITEAETWNLVGMLLSAGNLESIHDPTSGEMKIFEVGKKYEILNTGRRRRIEEKEEGRGGRQGEDGRRGGHPRGGKRTQGGGREEGARKGGRRPGGHKENRGSTEGQQHGAHGSADGARRPQSN
ncbi:MAG: hypothetical protein J4F28_06335 [Nitrosopumilaceae archaeon]|nr:hypothetical protein [Nitrosopumilaceae archaeon]